MPCHSSVFHRCLINLSRPPFRLLRMRLITTRPRIDVVSSAPESQRPTHQQHQWSFLTDTRAPINTQALEQDDEIDVQSLAAAQGGRKSEPRKQLFLNSKDWRIIDFVRKTEDYFNETREEKDKVSAYAVGGWVRDKLLGKSAPDMDLVLVNIMPSQFVQAMIDINGLNDNSPRLFEAKVRHEKRAKERQHLRVASYRFPYVFENGQTLEVVGLSLFTMYMKMEVVNVRSVNGEALIETDARERELTINALYMRFQNLAIRDPTGMGLKDLRSGTLRTPKLPVQTYTDDPIRILRAMRFASRFREYGFKFDKETRAALEDDSVALSTRYEPARLYRELSIMLKARNRPVYVLRLLHETKYYRDLFVPPRPAPTPAIYIPPTISAEDTSHVTSSWFVDRLVSDFDIWSSFELALENIPSPSRKPIKKKTRSRIQGLTVTSEIIQGFAYAIASVMPWRCQFSSETRSKTYAGAILSQFGRVIKDWRLVDDMFANDSRTMAAVGKLEARGDIKGEYGEYWACHVLCGMMFRWCSMCQNRMEEADLEEVWSQSRDEWKRIAEAVNEVYWREKEKEGTGS